jgi:hypothetical protein
MIFLLFLLLFPGLAKADCPNYISLLPNINDFTRFADGGPDGNWYIGFNNAWIVKLPPAPEGSFDHAYIGAKIGRAKSKPNANRPWLRDLIAGNVYMGISQSPAFSSEQSFFLADARDIGAEPVADAPVPEVGPARWFWAEIPMNLISSQKSNYLAIWSPSESFISASSSPILGAATISSPRNEAVAWNNHSIIGVPPRSESGALQTPMTNLSPALAIRLSCPAGIEPAIDNFSIQASTGGFIARFSITGQDIAQSWIEASEDSLDWTRVTRYLNSPPYLVTLSSERLKRLVYLRGAAQDSSGRIGKSLAVHVP